MAYGTVKVDNITFDNGGSDQNVTVSGLYRATTSGVTVSGTIVAATVSGVTIIGSTTVSGATVTGTTANFTSGNFTNLISAAATMSGALIMANQQQVRFREAVGNGVNHIALQAPAIVSADQTITLPDQTGTVITTGDNGSVSSTMLATNLTISAGVGSATTPSIAFTGDLNTGIYSPGADQLAVSTGGTGRLFVASDGKVGVGTASPNANLHIAGPTAPMLRIGDFDNSRTINSEIRLNRAGGAQPFAKLSFYNGATSTAEAQIFKDSNGLATLSDVHVFMSAAYSEYMRIDSSGRVGIGTGSPSEKLHVSGVIIGDANDNYFGSYSSGGAYLDIGNLATSAVWLDARSTSLADVPLNIRSKGTGEIAFHGGFGEKVRIDSSGRVGIGTSSPAYSLHLSGINATSSTAQITTTATSDATVRTTTSLGTFAFGTGIGSDTKCWNVYDIDNSAERLRIDSSGRVGIGTSSPGYALDIQSTDTGVYGHALRLRTNATSSNAGIQFANPAGNIQYGAVVADTSSNLKFFTVSTERMRITAHPSNTSIRIIGSSNSATDTGEIIFVNTDQTTYWGISTNITNLYIRDDNFSNYAYLTQNPTAWQFASDARLKENIIELDYGINTLKQIKPCRFNFIGSTVSQIGFIAQELRGVVPEAVSGEDVPYDDSDTSLEKAAKSLGVGKETLIPVIVKALQEAVNRIETLEGRLTAAGID